MSDCLARCPRTQRSFTGLVPVADRLESSARLGQVLGNHLRLVLDSLRKRFLENLGDAGMEAPARRAKERPVRRLSNEGVLEHVRRVGERTALVQELRAH